ncbi:ComEC/Rec2 family competence protein [Maricaulis sp.]|uniref:ComEC/Rec2 family competence protein n=1 Tax=Maricaulis sp. TaxID=1486257 RepID=UPI0025BBF63B|nr:ComEC/Rec2 family competence protein [Maricaulis sp.]
MLQPDAILPQRVARNPDQPVNRVDPLADFSPAVLVSLGAIIGCAAVFSGACPSGWRLVSSFLLAAFLAFGLARFSPGRRIFLRRLAAMMTVILLAAAALAWRATSHEAAHHDRTPIADGQRAVELTGWLEAIDRSASGRQRLLVRLVQDANDPRARRVRVLGNAASIRPGDPISLRAVLAAPRPAAIPGGYDFAFHAAFRDIVATGYAIAPADAGPELEQDELARAIARLRADMSGHIRGRMADRPGALAAALLTGDRAHIDPGDVDALRRSGLGHVLAISGMHMALLAGGVFFAVRLGFSAISPWARRHDAAVPAAWVALVFAAGYLLLSGAAIPTQRAFIMTVSVLGAVILGRRALSLHTLALAVTAVLVMQPQAVVTPGFQMSFSAAAALITAARVWQAGSDRQARNGVLAQIRLFFGGLGTTSLVAGTATAGFAAFHFHRIASFGLAGNLLVMPIFSTVVMPAGVLGLVLIPLGLDGLPFALMEWGLSVMLDLAHRVADWPGAQRHLPAAPGLVLAIFSAGFVLTLLVRGRWRASGAALIAVALAGWAVLPQPNLFISDTGLILARDETGQWVVSDRRRSRFAARVFLEARAVAQPAPAVWDARCDGQGCSARLGGLRVTRLLALDDWQTDCARADLIIADMRVPPPVEQQCGADIIDTDVLERTGSQSLYLRQGEIVSVRHARPAPRQGS